METITYYPSSKIYTELDENGNIKETLDKKLTEILDGVAYIKNDLRELQIKQDSEITSCECKIVKKHYISETDIDKSIVLPVITNQLIGKQFQWGIPNAPTSLGLVQVNEKEVTIPMSGIYNSTGVTAAGLSLSIGEALSAHFVDANARNCGVVVTTQSGYAFFYINNANFNISYGIKKINEQFKNNQLPGFNLYQSYLSKNSLFTIERISDTSFIAYANGVCITNGVIDIGEPINFCGFGVYGNTVNLKNYTKEINRVKRGAKPLSFTIIGDSLSVNSEHSWDNIFKDALDGSCGVRVGNIVNYAVGGNTSTQQLQKLQTLGLPESDYVIVLLGTNDIQCQTPISDYINNIDAIVNLAKTTGCRVILAIPPLFYPNIFKNGEGQNTSNYEKGVEYRGGLLRYAAENKIKVVDLMSVFGQTTADYDVVVDNIHPSFKTSELMGVVFAKAVLGDYFNSKNNI